MFNIRKAGRSQVTRSQVTSIEIPANVVYFSEDGYTLKNCPQCPQKFVVRKEMT